MASPNQSEQPADAESYGESARAILAAVAKSEHHETTSEMHHFDLSLTPVRGHVPHIWRHFHTCPDPQSPTFARS